MRAEGALCCASSISYFRRRRNTTEECSQLTDSTLSVAHHGLSSLLEPNASTKRFFFPFLYYYATLFCQRRATHTASRISAISGRMQKSAPNSLIVRLALLTMVYWHDSVPGVSTKQYLIPLFSTLQHSFAKGALHTQHLVFLA